MITKLVFPRTLAGLGLSVHMAGTIPLTMNPKIIKKKIVNIPNNSYVLSFVFTNEMQSFACR